MSPAGCWRAGSAGSPCRCGADAGLERRVAALADAIVCVSGRDRRELASAWSQPSRSRARTSCPAAYDEALFDAVAAVPPGPRTGPPAADPRPDQPSEERTAGAGDAGGAAAAGERFELTIAGRGEGSKELIRLIARSPARGQGPLGRRRAPRRGAQSAARARHPAADQPLRGLADRGQRGAAGACGRWSAPTSAMSPTGWTGSHRLHLRAHAGALAAASARASRLIGEGRYQATPGMRPARREGG